MYRPKPFIEDRLDVLHDFIKKYPLGLILTPDLEANLIPINLYNEENKGILRCHFARMNTQLDSLQGVDEVLVTFTGPQGYVTPEVYPTKKIHGKAVPTWNYSMVQVKGKPHVIDDSEWVLQQIQDLTEIMEVGRQHPWKVSDAPDEYIQSQLKGIVGVEIIISKIEGKFKVSQNQPEENRRGVEEYFRNTNNFAMADYVTNCGIKK